MFFNTKKTQKKHNISIIKTTDNLKSLFKSYGFDIDTSSPDVGYVLYEMLGVLLEENKQLKERLNK